MAGFFEELKPQLDKIVPESSYFSAKRFINPYENSKQFWEMLLKVGYLPIVNGLKACYYATRALWATVRAVGNLLIIKPGYAVDALRECSANLVLAFCSAIMAPVRALTASIELLTRILSSWFIGKESDDLSKMRLVDRFKKAYNSYGDLLPSSSYFQSSRFFSPYENVMDFLGQLFSPLTTELDSGFRSLGHAFKAVISALDAIANVIICKPRHALENVQNLSMHLSLSFALAIMAPINALVESIVFISRLGSTWIAACASPEERVNTSLRAI
ncbi:MAG: type IV secretion protein Dot [Legionella sp.]|uniref:type IV secretion protein Dot n=1 Tax=Legionella sp. TaxID=459 RepID=UPI0039E3C5A6